MGALKPALAVGAVEDHAERADPRGLALGSPDGCPPVVAEDQASEAGEFVEGRRAMLSSKRADFGRRLVGRAGLPAACLKSCRHGSGCKGFLEVCSIFLWRAEQHGHPIEGHFVARECQHGTGDFDTLSTFAGFRKDNDLLVPTLARSRWLLEQVMLQARKRSHGPGCMVRGRMAVGQSAQSQSRLVVKILDPDVQAVSQPGQCGSVIGRCACQQLRRAKDQCSQKFELGRTPDGHIK